MHYSSIHKWSDLIDGAIYIQIIIISIYRTIIQWRTAGGAECSPDAFHWEISTDLPGKERQGIKGKWRRKKRKLEYCKREGWKNGRGKMSENEQITFFLFLSFLFFFFLLFTFWNQLNLFGVYKNGNFYLKKAFYDGKKTGKVGLPLWKTFLLHHCYYSP